MNRDAEEKNAIIESVSIDCGDHGVLSAHLTLNYGGTGQVFGGYCLYSPHRSGDPGNYAGLFFWRVLEVVGVTEWSRLKGQTVRVKASGSKVEAIGHIVNDKWFNPSEEFEALRKKALP